MQFCKESFWNYGIELADQIQYTQTDTNVEQMKYLHDSLLNTVHGMWMSHLDQ